MATQSSTPKDSRRRTSKTHPHQDKKTWTNGQPIVNQQFLKKLYSSSIQTRYLLPISTKLSDSPPGSTKTLLRLSTNMPLKVIIVLMSKSKQFLKSPAFHKEEKRGKNNLHGVWQSVLQPKRLDTSHVDGSPHRCLCLRRQRYFTSQVSEEGKTTCPRPLPKSTFHRLAVTFKKWRQTNIETGSDVVTSVILVHNTHILTFIKLREYYILTCIAYFHDLSTQPMNCY